MLYPHALDTVAKVRGHLKEWFSKLDVADAHDLCQWLPAKLGEEFTVLKAGFRQNKGKRKSSSVRLQRWASEGECKSLGVYVKAVLDTQIRHAKKSEQVARYESLVREMKRHARKLEAEAGVIGKSSSSADRP